MLSFLRFHCGTKGFALCGVLLPSTPLWNVFALLCAAALRYSSLMFQVPLWTSTKAHEYPILPLCALSPPVRCCLPAPCLPSLCGCSCVRVLVLPPLFCPRLLSGCSGSTVCAWLLGSSLSFGRLSRVLYRFIGAPVCCLHFEFVCVFMGATQSLRSLAVSLPPLVCSFLFCASGLGFFFWFPVVCWWAPCPGLSWGAGLGK